METLSEIILGKRVPSGVYWIGENLPTAEIERISQSASINVFRLDGNQIQSYTDFFTMLSSAMGLGEDCIHNWDTLLDCIRNYDVGLYKKTDRDLCLLFDQIQIFAEHDRGQFEDAIDCFQQATALWVNRVSYKRMYILLMGQSKVVDYLNWEFEWNGKQIYNNYTIINKIIKN